MKSPSVVRLCLHQQVVFHFLLFNVPSADLAHSCAVLETAPVPPFLPCLFKLAAQQTVLFNHCDLDEEFYISVSLFSKPKCGKTSTTAKHLGLN